jgi:ABC-type antimicrobial peptide transport system permease subunit
VHSAWPGKNIANAIGRQISNGLTRTPQTIIGVVDDVRLTSLDSPLKPAIYLSESQFPYPFLTYVVRGGSDADPSSLVPALQSALKSTDPSLALDDVMTYDEVVSKSLGKQRFGMLMAVGFAAASLFLAAVGLYGVIATGVAQRTRELGIRMALGASQSRVLRIVMYEGAAIAASGVVVGLAIAAAASRFVGDQLYKVSATDSTIYASVALMTISVALVATLLPAIRATRLDPLTALRSD